MNTSRCSRNRLHRLIDLPYVGYATARNLMILGIEAPGKLVGCGPLELYRSL